MMISSLRNGVVALFALTVFGAIIGVIAKPPSRIVGGRLANPGEFSFIVTLSHPNNFIHLCGGSIISPLHILTAAHCVKNERRLVVHSGTHRIGSSDDVVTNVQRIILHPNYVWDNQMVADDIAILVLEKELNLRGKVGKIGLPTEQPDLGKIYFVAGWGMNNKNATKYQFDLKVLNVKLADEMECQMRGSYLKGPSELCGYNENGNTCSGDSGGPLISGGRIAGIVSAGFCTIGVPTTYVNVYHYINWIKTVMRQTSSY